MLSTGLSVHGSVVELQKELINMRQRIAGFGRGQVREELKRQERIK